MKCSLGTPQALKMVSRKNKKKPTIHSPVGYYHLADLIYCDAFSVWFVLGAQALY